MCVPCHPASGAGLRCRGFRFRGRASALYAIFLAGDLLDEAHVYLCAINAELQNAFALFAHWGIRYDEMLVWNKTHPNGQPRMGMGQNLRHTCEFILFGVRGNLRTREAARSIGTSFEAPVGEHSEKPGRLYEIVRAASYPPFGELFGRKPRDGFTNLYQEAAQDITKAAA